MFQRPSAFWSLLLTAALCASSFAQCQTPPQAENDTAFYVGDPIVVIDVLANDSDPDGEALAVGNLSTTCTGSVSEDFGLVRLTVADFSGACTVSYTVTDESGLSDSAIVQILETPVFIDGFETGDTSEWSATVGKAAR